MTLYFLCGIPGSGKTTLARELAEQCNAKVHSYDDVHNAMSNICRDKEIRQKWVDAMNSDLSAGHNVVCDGTNLTVHFRKEIIRQLVQCRKILLIKSVPLEICLQRNKGREHEAPEHQIRMAAQILEPPKPNEGWDAIYLSCD